MFSQIYNNIRAIIVSLREMTAYPFPELSDEDHEELKRLMKSILVDLAKILKLLNKKLIHFSQDNPE